MSVNMKDLERRMEGAISALNTEFAGLSTGRASPSLLDPVQVDAYGAMMPMNQVGSVSVPESRLLSVTVWDSGLIKAVEKAIVQSNLGLNPQTEGNVIRIPIPELNEERRTELTKVAGKYAEQARIAVRNVRRDGMDAAKTAEKNGDMGKDEAHKASDDIQAITDTNIKKVDEALHSKEQEIMQV